MHKALYLAVFILLAGLLSSIAAQSRTNPSLTSEDVAKWRAAHPDRVEIVLPVVSVPGVSEGRSMPVGAGSEAGSWNERLAHARERALDLELAARNVEIQASQKRNRMFFGDSNALNASNSQIAGLLAQAQDLGLQAAAARAEVSRLIDEGQKKGYRAAKLSSRLDDGRPNLEYYRVRYQELNRELEVALAEKDSNQLRSNRFSTVINARFTSAGSSDTGRVVPFFPNNGAADLFYANRLYSEFGAVTSDLKEASDRIGVLKLEIDSLCEEGRRAGVPPGIFR